MDGGPCRVLSRQPSPCTCPPTSLLLGGLPAVAQESSFTYRLVVFSYVRQAGTAATLVVHRSGSSFLAVESNDAVHLERAGGAWALKGRCAPLRTTGGPHRFFSCSVEFSCRAVLYDRFMVQGLYLEFAIICARE